jgi:YjbR
MRALCDGLPEAVEEHAWTGIRWRIRRRTFAHVLTIEAGWPPAYARAAGTAGPAHVLMIRSRGAELDALRHLPPPFFTTPWRADEIGIQLSDDTDWAEIAELVTESYRLQAPARLARLVGAPTAEQPGDAC